MVGDLTLNFKKQCTSSTHHKEHANPHAQQQNKRIRLRCLYYKACMVGDRNNSQRSGKPHMVDDRSLCTEVYACKNKNGYAVHVKKRLWSATVIIRSDPVKHTWLATVVHANRYLHASPKRTPSPRARQTKKKIRNSY